MLSICVLFVREHFFLMVRLPLFIQLNTMKRINLQDCALYSGIHHTFPSLVSSAAQGALDSDALGIFTARYAFVLEVLGLSTCEDAHTAVARGVCLHDVKLVAGSDTLRRGAAF